MAVWKSRMLNYFGAKSGKKRIFAARLKPIAFLVLMGIGSWQVHGQNGSAARVEVENYSIEQGLSNRNVNYFARDKQGFLWIATFDGLNRFDGYDFLNYDCRPRSRHKIRYTKVYAVLPDRAGNLLVGYETQEEGPIDLLDPLTGRLTPFVFDSTAVFKGKCRAFFRAPDGALYFLIVRNGWGGVFEFDEQARAFHKVLETSLHPNMSETIVQFLKASDGTYWFAYQRKDAPVLELVRTDGAGGRIGVHSLAGFTPVVSANSEYLGLTEAAGKEIWLTVPGQMVYVIDTAKTAIDQPHPLLPRTAYYFTADQKGNFLAWQTTPPDPSKGCFLLTAGGQVIDYSWVFRYQTIIDQVFSDDFTQGLLAGSGNGFNHFRIRPERFKTFLDRELGDEPYGMSIRGMTKLGKDKLYIATERDGIFELDLKTNALTRPGERLPGLKMLNEFRFPRNLLTQGDSVVWITGLGGVLKYVPGRYALSFYSTSLNQVKAGYNEVWGITFAKDSKLWMVPRDGRLLSLDPASGVLSTYRNKDGSRLLEDSRPSFILAARDGTIWVGTSVAGLIRVDVEKAESQSFTANPGDPSGFNSNHITCIHEDETGLLWVGTMEGGLHVFDPRKGRVTAIYSRENGLRNNSTVGILPDEKDNYWLSTFSGLSYFDTKLKTFRNYTTADGLSHNEFNRFSYFFDPDYGRFYFGGMNGVNAFDQRDMTLETNDAPLLISEMSVTGQNDSLIVRHEGILDGSVITVAPGSRFLRLRLALGSYHHPAGNQFSYKIDGLDKDWNYLGSNRDLRIDRLPPGIYTLHLRGADDRGNWSSREIALRLIVQEFWYGRWWAYLLYAGIVAAAGFYFYRFQLGRRMAEKEAHRLQELDLFKSRFFTNISHEFRTPLTVILGMVEPLKKHFASGAEADHGQAAEMVRRNSRQLLNLVNQLLELSRLESGKLKLNLANGDLTAFLRYQLESFHSYALNRQVHLHFQSEIPEFEMAFDQDKIQTILVNLISNALKFTPEGGRIDLRFTIGDLRSEGAGNENVRRPASVHIQIADTGAGIPEDKLGRIFDRFYQVDDSSTRKSEGTGIGLALVQELVKLMNGAISVESLPGAGTTFYITLPYTPPSPAFQPLTTFQAMRGTLVEYEAAPFDGRDDEDQRPLLMIAEDNPDVRFYIAECVKKDYRIVAAENGAIGIQKAVEYIPDIIISDVMMPEKDGFELCETLKNDERTSHIPVVLLTARADVESRIAGLRRGADDYLAKPFEPGELLVRLENLVKLRRRLQQRYAGMPELPAPSQDPDLAPEDAFLRKIRDVVEGHLSETEFDMPQLERALGMSRSQVFRKVKALTGASPSVLLRNIRLHKAKELLGDKTRTIAEIAYEVGFSTPAYFSTMFLEAFGKTPSEWRQS